MTIRHLLFPIFVPVVIWVSAISLGGFIFDNGPSDGSGSGPSNSRVIYFYGVGVSFFLGALLQGSVGWASWRFLKKERSTTYYVLIGGAIALVITSLLAARGFGRGLDFISHSFFYLGAVLVPPFAVGYGWTFGRKKKEPNQPPEPMPLKRHGSS